MKPSQNQPSNPTLPPLTLGEAHTIETELDPHLQMAILSRNEGEPIDGRVSESTPGGDTRIDVIAKLRNPEDAIAELAVVRTIGQIVTANLDVRDIETVRNHPNVISLKMARRLHSTLNTSVADIGATQARITQTLPPNLNPINGQGVVVGVIDYGCDFKHPNFRKADGKSRVLALWDQRGGFNSLSPTGFGYGREFTTQMLDDALATGAPYQKIGYDPDRGSHGTHVLDIAAGNGAATGNPGVAPAADIVFVHIAHDDNDDNTSFGNSKMLLEAADYIFAKAQALGKSAVINMSLGSHGGPHDGSTLAEEGFDTLLQPPGRAIVIAAGNAWEQGGHAHGEVTSTAPKTLHWEHRQDNLTDNELEIWYSGDRRLAVTLISPNGERLGSVSPGLTVPILAGASTLGRIVHRQRDPNNGDNTINVFLNASLPTGLWQVELQTTEPTPVEFHAWIERDNVNQSRFTTQDVNPAYTIGSISCGAKTIAVGSYLSGVPTADLSPFSAEGPTRDGRQKPEISAPGQFLNPYWQWGILAANSTTASTTRMSGTSMASPHVTGAIALLMQLAVRPLTIDEIRTALIGTARPVAGTTGSTWHPRYGFGKIDVLAMLGTQVPEPVLPRPNPLGSTDALAAHDFNGQDPIFAQMLSALTATSNQSHTRVRIQIDVEPIASSK